MFAISNALGAEKILFINGIDTSKDNQNYIQEWVDKLNLDQKYDAYYVPTFGPGIDVGVQEVRKATPQVVFDEKTNGELEDPDILTHPEPSDLNGLKNDLLDDKEYDTIYAHSGGTRTAVTALLTQNVKTKTLVLISPVTYTTESKENFNRELEYLLQKGKVKNIIVYQSSLDYLLTGEFWQMKYDRNNPGIKTPGDTTFEVRELGLELLTGKGMPLPHVQMWYTVLKKDFGSNPDNSLTKFFKNIGTDFKKLIDPMISMPIVEASSDAGSSVSGTSDVSQTGTPQNNNYIMTKLHICNTCLFPMGVPQNWDWMYNKNDGNYYTTYNGYYWVYDPQDRDPTMVNGVLISSNPFPGSPPKYTTTSTAGVGPLV